MQKLMQRLMSVVTGYGRPKLAHRRRRDVEAATRDLLCRTGWVITSPYHLRYSVSFIAKRGPTILAVLCSGEDSRLLPTMVKDLRQEVLVWGYHPVFVHGEDCDPQIYSIVRSGVDIVLQFSELSYIESAIGSLDPTFTGAVDRIVLPNVLTGWVKLSPHGKAELKAFLSDDIVGTGTANLPRSDMAHEGDGKFGFDIRLTVHLPVNRIISDIKVKAYFDGRFLRTLEFWDNIVVIDCP